MSKIFMIPPQIKRLALLFAIFIACFLVVRHFLIPKSFGKYGHYRADSLEDIKALPENYAGKEICAACHPEIAALKARSKHAQLACETCHGPALKHTEDPMSVKPLRPKDSGLCELCHLKDAARPKMMAQIDPDKHNVGMECFLCHNAHKPEKKE